jgi:putative membrane protein
MTGHGSMPSMTDADDRAHVAATKPEAAVRDHLANERTLLAWQRTALGVIAIGFLLDRFALDDGGSTLAGSIAGIALVILGAAVSAVGAYRFMRTEREIDTQTYHPALLAHLLLTTAIVVAAALLALFLIASLDQAS